ncbi:MAG: PilZ domain-containing protein [Methylococcaceae bacterium]|nr:PilZ domain-containing protein [Methylococcaceae bacterium]
MLAWDWDVEFSNAQIDALTDDILIDDLVGPAPVAHYFDKPVKQRRKCCRYVRDDIQAGVSDTRLLFRQKFNAARLIDISPLGLSIGCAKKLKCGQLLKLMLTFQDGHSFEFNGVVVHRRSGDEDMIYGLKFDKSNRQFEEHLLKTGLKIKLNNRSMTE